MGKRRPGIGRTPHWRQRKAKNGLRPTCLLPCRRRRKSLSRSGENIPTITLDTEPGAKAQALSTIARERCWPYTRQRMANSLVVSQLAELNSRGFTPRRFLFPKEKLSAFCAFLIRISFVGGLEYYDRMENRDPGAWPF